MLRKILKEITPPAIHSLTRWMRGLPDPAQSDSMFQGNYASFAEAAGNAIGYDDADASDAAARRLETIIADSGAIEIDGRIQQVHSALCIAREKLKKQKLSVLDFGGGNGGYYFYLKNYFPENSLDWTVIETPGTVRACTPIAAGQITYLTEIPAGQKYDVALASGVLHYVPDALDVLRQLMSVARWVIVTRLPVQKSADDKFMVQTVPAHMYRGSMPVVIFSEARIRAAIEAKGDIEQSWLVALDEGSLSYIRAKPVGYLVQVRQ